MKIHITENVDQIIDGYLMVPIVYGKIDLSSINNNCVTDIIADDTVDSIDCNYIFEFLNILVSKMRINGKLFISGLDLNIISQEIVSGITDYKEYNSQIKNKKAIYPVSEILKALTSLGLNIQTVNIKGNRYEIFCTRSA